MVLTEEADPRRRRNAAGAIVIALAAAAVVFIAAQRTREVNRQREADMRAAVTTLRNALRTYTSKHGHHPSRVEDLVSDGELRSVPVDPVTRSSSTWRTTVEESVRVDDFQTATASAKAAEIIDVHSGASGSDGSGRPWSDY